MADGDLTLKLDDYAAEKLASKAEALGMSREELASVLLDQRLFDYDDFDWINGDPRARNTPKPGLNEAGRDWAVVRPEFLALIDKAFGKPE